MGSFLFFIREREDIYICLCVCIYIYIYILARKERERLNKLANGGPAVGAGFCAESSSSSSPFASAL